MKPLYQLKPLKKALFLSSFVFGSSIFLNDAYAATIAPNGSTNNMTVGGTIDLSAQLTGDNMAVDPTGSISFYISSVNGDPTHTLLCTASLITDGVDNNGISITNNSCQGVTITQVGDLHLSAEYTGDGGAAAPADVLGGDLLVVNKASSTVSPDLFSDTLIKGQPLSISVSINGYHPGGSVAFQLGDQVKVATVSTNGNTGTARATLTVPTSSPDIVTLLTISYLGDSNNAAFSQVRSLKLVSLSSPLKLSAPFNIGGVNQPLTLTLTAPTDPPLTGLVSFMDNDQIIPGCSAIPLSSGKAECTTTQVSLGSHIFKSIYSGADFGTIASQFEYLAIEKIKPVMKVSASLSSDNRSLLFNVNFPPNMEKSCLINEDTRVSTCTEDPPVGEVVLAVRNNPICTAMVSSGTGSCSGAIPASASASSVISATFSPGNNIHQGVSTLITLADAIDFPVNGWYYEPVPSISSATGMAGAGVGYFLDSRFTPEGIKGSLVTQNYREDGSPDWTLATGFWSKDGSTWKLSAPIGAYCCGEDFYKPYIGFALTGIIGNASLAFKDSKHATLNLSLKNGKSEQVLIDKFDIGSPSATPDPVLPETGLYQYTPELGSGLAVELRDGVEFTTMFTYRDRKPIWYLAQGSFAFSPIMYTGYWTEYRKPTSGKGPEIANDKVAKVRFQNVSPAYFYFIMDETPRSIDMTRYEW